MRRIEGTSDVRLIECVNPVRGKWRIRWDVQPGVNGTATYMEAEFPHRPTADEIRQAIIDWYDRQTDEMILTGYQWNVLHGTDAGKTVNVWLSMENQKNYESFHNAAILHPNLVTFPQRYKLGEDECGRALYEEFQNVEELVSFYLGGVAHINGCIAEGWRKKDSLDLSLYET